MSNWVLIRGLSRETRHWGDFLDILATKYPHSKIITLELPGIGKNTNISCPASIEGIVEFLRPQFLNIKNKYRDYKSNQWSVIAISLGAMIALKWIEKYPEDFKKIVTINTSASNLSSLFQRMKIRVVLKLILLFLKNDVKKRENDILKLTTNMTRVTEELIDKWVLYAREYPLSRTVFIKQIYAAARYKAPNKINLPCLIIVGEKDQIVDPHCSKKLAQHFGLPYLSHPIAGHDIPLDAPDWLANEIYQWDKTNMPRP